MGVERRNFSSEMLKECLVCVFWNSYSIHSFIRVLNFALWLFKHWRWSPPILCTFHKYFFSIFQGHELRQFFLYEMLKWCLVCVICNFNCLHSSIFKLCTMLFTHWRYAYLILCTFDKYFSFWQVLNLGICMYCWVLILVLSPFLYLIICSRRWFIYLISLNSIFLLWLFTH